MAFSRYTSHFPASVSPPREPKKYVAKLGVNLTWRRNQFCRGWLITGDTGSGKTSSGINQLCHQVFPKRKDAGAGYPWMKKAYVLTETLSGDGATLLGRGQDLIHLQIQTNDADLTWIPPHRFNLTGDRSIPFSTYAKFVVDTATSLGQGGDKGFFKSQAQTHIAPPHLELAF